MAEIIQAQRLDLPMEVAEPYIDVIHHGSAFGLPYIETEEQDAVDELNSKLEARGCFDPDYIVDANRALFLPSSPLVVLRMIDRNVFLARLERARVLKLTERVHRLSFRGLCLEFADLRKISGDDFEELPDETSSEDRVVFQALHLRQTTPYAPSYDA